MSKKNKRRFWQSQKAHLDYLTSVFKDLDLWDYHMEVYRQQRRFGRILPYTVRCDLFLQEVHRSYVYSNS